MTRRRSALFVLFAISASACSHPATPNTTSDTRRAQTVERRRSDLITPDEIATKQWSTVYEMIAELRPRWLNEHGPDTINAQENVLMVHINGTRYGDVRSLTQMPVVNITFIQYYSPNEAAARWGFGYNHGAIDISTMKR